MVRDRLVVSRLRSRLGRSCRGVVGDRLMEWDRWTGWDMVGASSTICQLGRVSSELYMVGASMGHNEGGGGGAKRTL